MSDKIMTIEELAKMQEKVIDATKSDAPVAIETPTTSVVNGDPSKVQSIDPKNYTVELWLPVTSATPATAERVMDGTAYKQFVNADQKFITARIARKVRNYASIISIAFTDFRLLWHLQNSMKMETQRSTLLMICLKFMKSLMMM